ncbi:MAG: hypothetical protein UU24_C0005G0042 [Candidatus Nomurabacteria bacterium GW2011_GWA2_40_9]|uniref:Uncharacterized protein n=1 Tax=Candidatus Nomurabacteria bacterium GW2011_GWA2_40_9 TaxID=1618734 RepID=A0A0G0TRM3_9BACT|nr:MAG: hypothetical protein UU24_C0005G0042 [Candidatus Nomurabacteria bacterium GW2011_GWA2_40_9]
MMKEFLVNKYFLKSTLSGFVKQTKKQKQCFCFFGLYIVDFILRKKVCLLEEYSTLCYFV